MLDLWTFAVFGILVGAGVFLIVKLGPLPGLIARKREHPQADAIMAAGWIGLFAGFVGWGLALIWAFYRPGAWMSGGATGETQLSLADARMRIDALEARLAELTAGEGASS